MSTTTGPPARAGGPVCFTWPLRVGYPKLTGKGDSQFMRTLAATLVALCLLAFAGTAVAARGGAPPPFPHVAGAWWHVEINVTIKRVPHTLSLDRGRITQVNSAKMTLREKDGSIVVMPLSPTTIVTLANVPSTVFALKKGMNAQTMRIDNGAAVRVRATF
jgi:hypothetical protein